MGSAVRACRQGQCARVGVLRGKVGRKALNQPLGGPFRTPRSNVIFSNALTEFFQSLRERGGQSIVMWITRLWTEGG